MRVQIPPSHHDAIEGSPVISGAPLFPCVMVHHRDLNANPPPTNRRKSATHWSASGGRAGREGGGLAGRSLIGQIPPSAPSQYLKGIWPRAKFPFS